jgi:hypothetical protein
MPFLTRPHFEDRQIVQYGDESIKLSGTSYIASTVLGFSGITTGETSVTINTLTGYLRGERLSGLVVEPARLELSGTTGTTTQNVTGFVLQSIDPYGSVAWAPLSGVSWSVSACTSPLYVSTIEACPNPTDPIYVTAGNVQFGGSIITDITNNKFGVGTLSPSERLHVNGNAIISGTLNIGTVPTGDTISILAITSGGTVVDGTNMYGEICKSCSGTFTSSGTTIGTGTTVSDLTDNLEPIDVDCTSPKCCTQWEITYYGNRIKQTIITTNYDEVLKYKEAYNAYVRCIDSNNTGVNTGGIYWTTDPEVLPTPTYDTKPSILTGVVYDDISPTSSTVNEVRKSYKVQLQDTSYTEINQSNFIAVNESALVKVENSINGVIAGSSMVEMLSSTVGFIKDSNRALMVASHDSTIKDATTSSIISSESSVISGGTTGTTIVSANGVAGTDSYTLYTDNIIATNDITATTFYGDGSNLTGVSGGAFTGNTSGSCITDLYITNLYGCSPLHIEPSGLNDVYMVENGGNVGIGTTSPTSPLHISSDNTVNRGLYIQTNYSGNSVNEGIRVLNWTDSVETPLSTYGGLFWGRANAQNRFSYGVIGAAGLVSWTVDNVMIGVRGVAGTSLSNNINAYGMYGESAISNGGDNIGGYFVSENAGSGNTYAIIVPPSGGTVGIGTEAPTELLHVSGGDILVETSNGKFYSDLDNAVGTVIKVSGGTNGLVRMATNAGSGGISVGHRGITEPSFPGYGKQGDGFLYSSAEQNGLNILSQQGTGKDDYIRFYVGQITGADPANTPDIHIQGSGVTRGNVGINTKTPTEKLHVEGSIKMVDGNESNGYVLTSDANGVGSWVASAGGGGGATIDPYQDEGNVNSITWDVSGTSTNYEATLTGVTTLNMSNVRNGDYGTLIVTQDGVGSHTLSFVGGTHKVVNGGGGAPTLTSTSGATDILSFTYNGTNFYWTVGNDYT